MLAPSLALLEVVIGSSVGGTVRGLDVRTVLDVFAQLGDQAFDLSARALDHRCVFGAQRERHADTLGDDIEPLGHQHIGKANRLFLAATLVFTAVVLGGRVLIIKAIEKIGANL